VETFCHFFDDVQGFCVNENSKRNVLRFTIEDTPVRTFYLKRFYRAQIKDTIGAVWRFRRPMSQGAIEWTNARHLQSHGIQTGNPVCCREQTGGASSGDRFWLPKRSKVSAWWTFSTGSGGAQPDGEGADRGGTGETGPPAA